MTPERWREIKTLFERVADRPAAECAETLAKADPELHAEVEKVLAGDGQGRTLIANATVEGAAYRAVRDDGAFDKLVAIKVLRVGMETPSAMDSFRRERTILAGLEHPHIARLLDGGAPTPRRFRRIWTTSS